LISTARSVFLLISANAFWRILFYFLLVTVLAPLEGGILGTSKSANEVLMLLPWPLFLEPDLNWEPRVGGSECLASVGKVTCDLLYIFNVLIY